MVLVIYIMIHSPNSSIVVGFTVFTYPWNRDCESRLGGPLVYQNQTMKVWSGKNYRRFGSNLEV
jgi:hypothetical protein